jgi:hypothetical protein
LPHATSASAHASRIEAVRRQSMSGTLSVECLPVVLHAVVEVVELVDRG